MTPRERVLATIRHQTPDRVPVDAICIENAERIAAEMGIPNADVADRLGIDGRLVAAGFTGPLPVVDGTPRTEWGSASVCSYDTTQPYPLAEASVGQVERYAWPDPNAYDYAGAAEAARSYEGRYAVRGPYWKPVFCQVCELIGLERALTCMLTDPAVFEALVDRVMGVNLAYCEQFLVSCGEWLDLFCLGDDFATQHGLMMEPRLWRRFLRPQYARLFALAQRHGKPVWFHSCGDVTAVLPDLIDIGMDVWETVQLHTLPMSPEALKREYGQRLTFFGGVNTQRLPFVGPDAVRAEVVRCIEALGAGGGYICGPDHHVKPDVTVANTLALFDTATSYRAEGYTTLSR